MKSGNKRGIHIQPSTERVAGSSGRRIVLTLLSTVLFLLAFNFFVGTTLKNSGYGLIKYKWNLLADLEQPVDIIVAGDSSCNQGVIPELLEQHLGAKTINVCTIGNMLAIEDVWMLEFYLQRHQKLSAVILVHVYDSWHRDINPVVVAQVPLKWGFWNEFTPPLRFTFNQQVKMFAAKYFPLYSENRTLSKKLLNPWLIKENDIQLSPTGFFGRTEPNMEKVNIDAEAHFRFVRKNKFDISEPNRRALYRLEKLAVKYDFDVYLANSPIFSGLYEDEYFKYYLDNVNQYLKNFSSRDKRLHFLFEEPIQFAKEDMQNVDHVILTAAEIYTKEIVNKIKHIN